ncbi:hypothetical protein EMCRGX_G001389 [Ephydatia muelleri]
MDIRSGDNEGHECVPSLTPEEERQTAELLKRAISTSPNKGVVQLATGGAVKEVFDCMVTMLAGLPGMKGLYQPVKVDSKAIQEFMAFYHILKQQSPFKCISWRIMEFSGQIPAMLASAFWENWGLN